jgi:hypothetical protein
MGGGPTRVPMNSPRCAVEVETSRCIFRLGHPGVHLLVHIYGPEVLTSGEGLVPEEEWVYEPELPDDGKRARETLVEEWGIYWTDELIRWLVRERRADQPTTPRPTEKRSGTTAVHRRAASKPTPPTRRPASKLAATTKAVARGRKSR